MGRAINERSEKPVVIPESLIEERDKRKRRRALGRLKGELARGGVAHGEKGESEGAAVEVGDEAEEASAQAGDAKSRKRKGEGKDDAEPRTKKPKRDRTNPAPDAAAAVLEDETAAPAADADDASTDAAAKKAKRKKNRHTPRTPLEVEVEADGVAESTPSAPVASTSATPAEADAAESAPPAPVVKPPKKRGRESKYLGTVRTPEERPPPRLKAASLPMKRMKRTPGGVLAALRGDGTEVEPKPVEKAVGEKPEEKAEEKAVKTSVLKVIEVAKKKSGGDAKVDVASLLGFPAAGDSLGLGGWN